MNYSVEHLILPSTIIELKEDTLLSYNRVKVLTIAHDFLLSHYYFENPFKCLKSLQAFQILNKNLIFYTEKGILYSDNADFMYSSKFSERYTSGAKILIAVPPALPIDDLVIPEGVIGIRQSAFNGCRFKSITLPNSLEAIGICAFSDMEGLECIKVPNKLLELGSQIHKLENVRYEGKDGVPLDEEVCEMWNSIINPKDFLYATISQELGEKSWPHHYLNSFHYVYPNDEMANDVRNITTLDEWIALMESIDERYGKDAPFMRAMLLLEFKPNLINCDTEEEASRFINSIWGSNEEAKQHILSFVNVSDTKKRWKKSPESSLEADVYNKETEYGIKEFEEKLDIAIFRIQLDTDPFLKNQDLFILAQLATSAPMLFLDCLDKHFLEEKILTPFALKILEKLCDDNDKYAISNYVCAYKKYHLFLSRRDEMFKYNIKAIFNKAISCKNLYALYEALWQEFFFIVREERLVRIEELIELCLQRDVFVECLSSREAEFVKLFAQNQLLWIKKKYKNSEGEYCIPEVKISADELPF